MYYNITFCLQRKLLLQSPTSSAYLVWLLPVAGIASFEIEYGNWLEEQKRQICELRTALQPQIAVVELRLLVDTSMHHYVDLFRMKAAAAKADVFYLMSGMWKSPAERVFFWLGGFRPSELLKVIPSLLDTDNASSLRG